MTASESDFIRIAHENARFNVGPINRNLNVPTAALFFFQPANLSRFSVYAQGSEERSTASRQRELEFKETQRPTLIMRRAGADVPMEGTLWVVPADGAVVRTRLRLKNFADALAMPAQDGAPLTGSRTKRWRRRVRAGARDVCRHAVHVQEDFRHGTLAPLGNDGTDQGPISGLKAQTLGRATTNARYSDFKTFSTGAAIKR